MDNRDTISSTLGYPESADQANEYLRLVLPMLARFHLPPNPINFTLCYEYVANSNSDLSTILDKVLNDDKGLTNEAAVNLYRRFIWDAERRKAEQQSNELSMVMNETLSGIDKSSKQVSHSSRVLKDCSNKLSANSEIEEMRNVIAEVVSETKSIATNSQMLYSMLTETKHEVEVLRQELERSREQATTDPLTGLLNRRAFDEEMNRLTTEMKKSRESLGLLMIDIDEFKQVNDSYGHLIGDKVIRFVAQQLACNIKGKDVVARIGGEEFAILLPSTSLDNARILSESIRTSIERSRIKRLDTGQRIEGVTVSIGVTVYKPGERCEDYIQRADEALYKSKRSGRNKVSIAF